MSAGGTVTPVLVFPHAHQRGGVERMVWQALKAFAERGPVCFVGTDIDPPIPGVRHLTVTSPRRSS